MTTKVMMMMITMTMLIIVFRSPELPDVSQFF